ncbi:helicase C-terminal domain-containing protein [Paenibacillus sp. CN-4]|uniref:helicase C-terminal domain-containing protein n=1 Tax=Paenibacillus nanchangensis TaxID=3348343 RepID=UPI003979D23C
MDPVVSISVRTLVEYAYRSGSLVSGFRSAASMADGARIHQQLQREYREGDRKEVFLEADIPYGRLIFHVEGRCDGLLAGDDGIPVIEEIKSTAEPLDGLGEGKKVHWAQALMYAYMLAAKDDLPRVEVKLVYVSSISGERRDFRRTAERDELERFAAETLAVYEPYAVLLHEHARRRDESLRALPFPFPSYREGQRRFAGAVYRAVEEGVKLFAQAPTGIGKTVSTLFPSLKAIGEGKLRRVFYLTAKTVTRTSAEAALQLMEARGMMLHTVTITAKDKACFREEGGCTAEYCPYADGYYDRINGALMDLLASETLMKREVLADYARKHTVCPFELSLDAAYAADAVICDYNYVYDPRISLKRLPEEQKRGAVLLVDEAHNLVDRAREMFSASLTKAPFLELQRMYKERNRTLWKASVAVNRFFIDLRKTCGEEGNGRWEVYPEALPALLDLFTQEAEAELSAAVPEPGGEENGDTLLETYFAALQMQRIVKLYDDRYVTYAEIRGTDVYLKLFNVDPSYLLSAMSKGYRSQILFSATLSPLSYYREMLGAGEDDYSVVVPSPFHPEQWEVCVLPLSTRYRDRERSVRPLAEALGRMAERKGNYLAFFPSYQYLRTVYAEFAVLYPEVRTLVQETGMNEEARESFLAEFRPDQPGTVLGFAVLGGIFSEGVDLPGDRLNGVMVVGVGLPQLGYERNLLRDFFNQTGRNGFYYAYVYPGMTKVLQAGGRLIRSEQDSGTILLADDRFLQEPYAQLLPDEWRAQRVAPYEWDGL